MTEYYFCLVDCEISGLNESPQLADAKKFLDEAEWQGHIYNLEGFISAFNDEDISSHTMILRVFDKNWEEIEYKTKL